MRTFKVQISTQIDEASTTEEQLLNQKEFEIHVDRLQEIELLLLFASRPGAKQLKILPRVPRELEDEYEFVDWTNCEGFSLDVPIGRMVIDLGDGRALMGLTDWAPRIQSDNIAEVVLRMYFARKVEEQEPIKLPPKVFGKKEPAPEPKP